MILEVPVNTFFQLRTGDPGSHIYYVETEISILLLAKAEGFTFRADYEKTGDMNDDIFKESHLKNAIPVTRATDENILAITLLEQVAHHLAEISANTIPETSLLTETTSIED